MSCGLFTIRKLFCWFEQLNDLKSLQTSIFQLILACMLAATFLQICSWHSGGGRLTMQSSCVVQPSRCGIDGAAEMRKRIGDATRSDVTKRVTPVNVILWNVLDVFKNWMHGPQNSQLKSRVLSYVVKMKRDIIIKNSLKISLETVKTKRHLSQFFTLQLTLFKLTRHTRTISIEYN